MRNLLLIDAYAMIYRAYYAFIRAPRMNSHGENTSAIFGFVVTFEDLLKRCPTEENRNALTDEHLEMEALDTYMGQKDRKANIYYEFHPNGEIHFGPLFDYENSMFELLKDDINYLNDFNEYSILLSVLSTPTSISFPPDKITGSLNDKYEPAVAANTSI